MISTWDQVDPIFLVRQFKKIKNCKYIGNPWFHSFENGNGKLEFHVSG
jgi:hypothetical protein